MDRRHFLRAGILATGASAAVPSAVFARRRDMAVPGESPYGPLSDTPDENGLLLPAGFTSRIVAIGGDPVGETGYNWHPFPDGAATFDDGAGGYYYVCNSEVFDFMAAASGGVSAIHFGPDGEILDAYRILEGSNSNCAGGPTPWGTWLSGEENIAGKGLVWECDPTGATAAISHPAMGVWRHEAAAVDPVNETVYLTEDASDGRFYRYTPTAYPDLSAGTLEVCVVATDGSVTWGLVADPSGESAPTSTQVPEATIFPGNEGCWYHDGWVYFTSKGDHSVHGIDIASQKYTLIWKGDPDGLGIEGAVLSHVDNITVDAGSGDLIVAEDGGNMELVIITPDGAVAPFVRVVAAGHELSEMTGPVFSPNRDRLYFSSQRGPSTRDLVDVIPGFAAIDAIGAVGAHAGVTFEITGPFRGVVVPEVVTTEAPTTIPSPVTTLTQAAPDTAEQSSDDNGGGSGVAIGVGAVAVAAVVGGAVAFRQRRMRDKAAE
jgi:hypothetical protein